MSSSKRRVLITTHCIVPLCLFLYFLFLYLPLYDWRPIAYWDEARWIGRSFYWELFKSGDFQNPLWRIDLAYDQPMVANYYYGILLGPKYAEWRKERKNHDTFVHFLIDHNFYVFSDPAYNEYAQKTGTVYWGQAKEYIPQKTLDVIFYARSINAVVSAATVVLVYFLTISLFGFSISLLTVMIYGHNVLIFLYGLIAQSETVFLFFFFCGLILLYVLFVKKNQSILSLLSFSVISGVVAQTKLNGLLLLILYNVLSMGKCFKTFSFSGSKVINQQSVLRQVIGINILVIMCFVLLNPFLYDNPAGNTYTLFDHRLQMSEEQAIESDKPLISIFDRVIAIKRHMLGISNTTEFYSFFAPTLRNPEITIYPAGITLFILWGYYVILKHIRSANFLFFGVVYGILFISMCLYLNVDESRYYLPLAYFYQVFMAIGVWHGCRSIYSFLRRIV